MFEAPPPPPVIVVTGRGIATADRLAASPTIDRAAIERSASGRLEDVLRDVAGLASFRRSDSRSAHPTSQGLTLRGLGGNAASRVALTLDGVPQADPFGGWIAFGAIDPDSIDRIRLTRGGGIDAVAGTIDIDSRALDSGLTAKGQAALGSRDTLDAHALVGDAWRSGFASLAAGGSRGAGFVPIVAADRGPVDERAPFRSGTARARLVQSFGAATEAQLSASLFADRRTRGTTFSDNRQQGRDLALRLVGKGPTHWSALVYAQHRRLDSQFAAVAPGRTSASLTLDQHVPAHGRGARVDVARRFGAVDLNLGAEWRGVSGQTEEAFRFVAAAPTRRRTAGGTNDVGGIFAGAAWSRGGWSVSGEARADHWSMRDGRLVEEDIAGRVLSDDRFERRHGWAGSGRIALGRTLTSAFAVRSALYRGWRLPTLNELYRPFRAGADATIVNPRLDPERVRGVEAGIDWTIARTARLSATAFANRLDGAIANVSIGAGPGIFPQVGFVAAGGVVRQRQNVDAIRSRGIEIDGRWTAGAWRASLSYALTDASLRARGLALLDHQRPAQVARHAASASLGWTRGAASLDATLRFAGRQYEDDNNDRALPAATTLDAVGGLALTRHLAIETRVENAFDRQIVTTLGGDGTRERALPRTLWLGLRLR